MINCTFFTNCRAAQFFLRTAHRPTWQTRAFLLS